MFKFKNKDTRTIPMAPMTLVWCLYCQLEHIVNFEHVITSWEEEGLLILYLHIFACFLLAAIN